MRLSGLTGTDGRPRFPRVSGDEPPEPEPNYRDVLFSPRERG